MGLYNECHDTPEPSILCTLIIIWHNFNDSMTFNIYIINIKNTLNSAT